MGDKITVKLKDGTVRVYEDAKHDNDGNHLAVQQSSGKTVHHLSEVDDIKVEKGSPGPKGEQINEGAGKVPRR